MALETYRSKRNFGATPEPQGEAGAKGGNSFVVQKHDATRLHYDFRLEMDGVLKSWAVTKGPSLVPSEKRLAVHVEDHPLDYGSFEGTIPKGEYGGGTVIVWDRGTWSPIGDPEKGYAKGHLEFELHGERLKGRWHLVRMHGRPREKRENWLLIKAEDRYARAEDGPDILGETRSVASGREMTEVAGEAPGWLSTTGRIDPPKPETKPAKKRRSAVKAKPVDEIPARAEGRKAALPDFVEPMLATLVSAAPSGDEWLHEIKFDGYRLLARIDHGKVRLLTRSGLDWTAKFAAIATEAEALPDAIIDGEIVALDHNGAPSFSSLQAALSDGKTDALIFFAFDLLFAEGRPDIWPAGDLAVMAGIGKILGHEERPDEKATRALAEPWRPHRGAVAIFTWHCYDNPAL